MYPKVSCRGWSVDCRHVFISFQHDLIQELSASNSHGMCTRRTEYIDSELDINFVKADTRRSHPYLVGVSAKPSLPSIPQGRLRSSLLHMLSTPMVTGQKQHLDLRRIRRTL